MSIVSVQQFAACLNQQELYEVMSFVRFSNQGGLIHPGFLGIFKMLAVFKLGIISATVRVHLDLMLEVRNSCGFFKSYSYDVCVHAVKFE